MQRVVIDYQFDDSAQKRLDDSVERIGQILRNMRRRAAFANYFMRLPGAGELKIVERIAARVAAPPEETSATTE